MELIRDVLSFLSTTVLLYLGITYFMQWRIDREKNTEPKV